MIQRYCATEQIFDLIKGSWQIVKLQSCWTALLSDYFICSRVYPWLCYRTYGLLVILPITSVYADEASIYSCLSRKYDRSDKVNLVTALENGLQLVINCC